MALSRLVFSQRARYRASDQVIAVFDALETILNQIEDSKSQHTATFDVQKVNQAEYIYRVLGFLYGIYLEKTSELIRSLIGAFNAEHYLVGALVGRTLFETVALLRYYNNELLDIAKRAESSEKFSLEDIKRIVEVLDQHSRGGYFDWQEFWSTDPRAYAATLVQRKKSARFPNQPNPSQVRIGEAIKAWGAEEPVVMLTYDFFSELVHPNLGSNFLVMGYAEAGLAVGGETPHGLGKSISHQALCMLYIAVKELPRQLATIIWFWGTADPKRDLSRGG